MTREESIFEEIVSLPKPEREERLEALLGSEAVISRRVRALLDAHDAADSFLETPAAGVNRVDPAPPAADELVGQRIGRYKLLQKIGEGGCGVVYMAEQDEPVRRRVALKIIKLGMDTKAVIARFEAERQALSMMDHPNIARVLDVGATENGRPFFVMELVRGIPITRYCDEHSLSTVQRLELFLEVCSAVQHAHQKGVIHRDLKPSNILVTLHDGAPVPKVIDFGVAKATHGRLTNQTLFTAFEQFIGTPAYMSPEQAELSGLDIDTRSDIYSLGVLLYELLAGRPPFDPKTFSTAGLDEIRRVIREVEPPTPSSRLSTLGDADRTAIARFRSTAPANLASVLRGDLDWIVMKALEKNRTRRYDTANGFAMDIRRHLRNEPVMARPPSTAYLLQKLVMRHRLVFAATGVVLAALVAALSAVVARLSSERQVSETFAASAQAVIDSVQALGRSAASAEDPNLARSAFDIGQSALARLPADQPGAKARILETLGSVAFNIGDLRGAREYYNRAFDLLAPPPGGSDADYARALNNRAQISSAIVTQERARQMEVGTAGPVRRDHPLLKPAEQDLGTAIQLQQRTGGPELARSISNLGWVLSQQGNRAEGEAKLKEAIALQQGESSKLDLGQSYRRLGLLQIQDGGRAHLGLENLDRAVASDIDAFKGAKTLELASDYNFRAIAYAILDRNTDEYIIEAIDSYYTAIAIRQELKSHRPGVASAGNSANANLSRQGAIDEVLSLVAEARSYAVTHGDELSESYLLAISAFVFLSEEIYDSAEQYARRCYELRRTQYGADNWRTYNIQTMLAISIARQRKPERMEEARTHLQAAYAGFKRLGASLEKQHQIWYGVCLNNAMQFAAVTGAQREALQLLEELKAWEATDLPPKAAAVAGKRTAEVRAALERAAAPQP